NEFGKDFHVAVIGPAGENLVKFAAITCDFGRQAARCGIGAVMGSKKLKAIIVRGDKTIPAASIDELKETYRETVRWMIKHPAFDLWRRQGTMQSIDWANKLSCLPTKNFQEAQYRAFKKINGDRMESLTRLHNKGCYLCPIRCGQVNQAKDMVVEGPEYETAVMLGSNCALPSIEEIVYANYLCDQLGLDTISTGNIIAFAMECYERGYIDREDTGGVKLRFGSSEALNEMVKKIAYREGIGGLLAEGVKKASQTIGYASERFAMHVKGLEISGYDVRGAPAMGLAYATSDIGAHHNRAWAITYDIKMGRRSYSEDKVKWVIYLQHLRPLFDCLGVCRFPWVELQLNPDYYAAFYTYATGVKTSLEELLKGSERVWNLTRLINLRQGLKTEDDWLPPRVFEDPIPSGPLKGLTLNKEMFGWMVEKYYELRGWNKNGIPTKPKLDELRL
ncbi:TPA: aldehyde ferredoxin oxidoreductase, partial [Candidatus Bathyarchaeota archaeon]|nr:aldehyde ferredoxin oxidoreductase [Candidatus Bathyarchaeota archaeon]